ncbi:MAG: PPOX class F420-dependent oxidoreductase [Deltaproteobacteria bacterium]|nr:PPOX class F420-dependent oxidoreductase [Deltaproteobacteria bacterium]MBW2445297.1 PPOX class F420-dependent oxidoreductase [Deltaproteobacteria bacterium]
MNTTARSALDQERYVSLVTYRKTGRAVATPVWFALAGERFYVFTEADAGKVKRLRNDARVQLSGCNVRGKVHGAPYDGRAAVTDTPESIARAYDALRAKYGWQMRVTNLFSRLAGRIDGRAMLEIEVDGPASTG